MEKDGLGEALNGKGTGCPVSHKCSSGQWLHSPRLCLRIHPHDCQPRSKALSGWELPFNSSTALVTQFTGSATRVCNAQRAWAQTTANFSCPGRCA